MTNKASLGYHSEEGPATFGYMESVMSPKGRPDGDSPAPGQPEAGLFEARRHQALVQSSPDAILTVDNQRVITSVNPGFTSLLGYQEHEVLGRSVRIIHPSQEAYDRFGRLVYPAIRQQGSWRGEWDYRAKDGAIIPIDAVLARLGGQESGEYLAILRDISQRKQAQEAKRHSEQFLNEVFEAIQDGISVLDAELNIIKTNSWMEQMYTHKAPLLGRKCYEVYQKRSTPCPLCPCLRTLKSGEIQIEVVPYPSAQEPQGWIELTAFPLKDEAGKIRGVIEYCKDISVRKQAENDLRTQRDLLDSLFENILMGVTVWDQAGNLLQCNEGFTRLTGYGLETIKNLDDWFPKAYPDPQYRQKVLHDWQESSRQDSAVCEYSVTCLNGRVLDLEFRASFLPDGRAVVSMVDVCERRKAENALRESEDRFRALSEESPLGVSLIDQDGRYEYLNPAFINIFGYTLSDLKTGKDWFRLAYPDEAYRKEVVRLWQQDLDQYPQEDAHTRTLEVRCKNGESKTVMFRPVATTAHGQFVLYEDISERIQGELALKQSEEKFRQIVQSSPMGIHMFELRESGRLIFLGANPAADRILGIDHGQFMGKSIEEAFPSLMQTEVPGRYRLAARYGKSWYTEMLDYEDHHISGAFEVNAFQTAPGKVTVMFLDRTEQKRAQQDKAKLESQLRQAQKMEAVGTLAGGVAHDFNNILTAIMGYGELAQLAAAKKQDNTAQLDQIVISAGRARDLVKQLLTFSRRSETDQKPMDLNLLLVQSVKMLERTIPKMVDIQLILADGLDDIQADATQLEQVLMNLAGNASDAMPDGGRLVLETSSVVLDGRLTSKHLGLSAGRYVLLTVTDTGQGMDQKTLGQIFDPFFTTKEIGKGTGLGLSTVYGIVQTHNGHISCYSEPGEGATFKIYLPSVEPAGRSVQREESPQHQIPGGNETILLVDDEPAIREMGAAILADMGYQMHQAASGEEALKAYQEAAAAIDLVILDLGMPGMGGHRCLGELLAMDPGAKVLIASGYSANGKVKDTLNQGAAGFIAKPFTRRDLLETVRSLLGWPDRIE